MRCTNKQIEILENEWRGCYKDGWKGLICDESFAHPAKYSRALIREIYAHVIAEKWVSASDSVIDPFGGVALGGFDAMQNGLNWFGCELEAKFHGLGNQNIALWNERYSRMPNWGSAMLLNGDSRKLASVIRGAGIAVSSPPYIEAPGHGGGDWSINSAKGIHPPSYGETEGQLGSMREGDHSIAITSPPYNPPMSQDHNGTRGLPRGTTPSEQGAFVKYGNTAGQLEGMSMDGYAITVSSPPYPQPYTSGGGINKTGYGDGSDKVGDRTYQSKGGDRAEGNLETLDAEGFEMAISSPPFEKGAEGTVRADKFRDPIAFATALQAKDGKNGRHAVSLQARINQLQRQNDHTYGDNPENIGNQKGETFWSASRTILEQLHQVLAANAHAVFVVKAFVRNKQIVDFPCQWAQLCEAVGFKLIHHHRALLTEHYGTQQGFDGEDKHLTVARKSFFRRLAESKGSPKIDWESVLCFERR